MVVLKEILAGSRDGEWGKADEFPGSKFMTVIRGTDFKAVRVGTVRDVPRRFIREGPANRKRLQPWDIVFETAGGSKDRPTGRSLLLKARLFARTELPITCASFARFLRVDPLKAHPPYVFWLLQHLYNNRVLFKYQTQHTGVARFQYTIFAQNEQLHLPPLPTQRRIAAILSAYDDLIENNTRRIAILEELARRLYEEWFVHFRFPGHEGVKMVESEIGPVPEGWEVKTVEDTFEIFGGGTPSKKIDVYWQGGNISWYTPTDLTKSGGIFMDRSGMQITERGLKKSSARLFSSFSVMMTSRATLGVIAINTTEASTNQGFITCLPNDEVPLYTLYHWLKTNVEQFISLGTGATFKEITKGVFKTIQMGVPTSATVQEFESKVGPMMELVLRLQRKNSNLRTQRDLLLPKLISGEIDVSQVGEPMVEAAAE